MLLSGCWDVPSQPEIASKSMERAIFYLLFWFGGGSGSEGVGGSHDGEYAYVDVQEEIMGGVDKNEI